MIRVDNNKTVDKLTNRGMSSNRKRNAMIVLAIVLTTFMLTTVFSIGVSYVTSMHDRNIKMNGSDYDASLWNPTDAQIKNAPKFDNVKYAGLCAGAGMITKYEGIPAEIGLLWGDETYMKDMVRPATEYMKGSYPKEDDEIMLSEKALKLLNIEEPVMGMKIETEYFTPALEGSITWTLSGYYKDYTGNADAYVNEKFHEHSEVEHALYIKFDDPIIDDKYVEKMSAEMNVTDDQRLQANTELAEIYKFVIIGVTGLILLIVASGYLLIYNLFYISITNDVRYYGLLKTAGITSRQINRILKKQVMRLALMGIPMGLILGALTSLLAVPKIVDAVSYLGGDVSFNPLIFMGAAIFSLITIAMSVGKPIRIAKNISPVEASKYLSLTKGKGKKSGTGGGKISVMAWNNVFRNRKKAVVVFLSLVVGISSFLAATAVITSNGADNVLNTLLTYDYKMLNKSQVNVFENKKPKQLITDEKIDKINALAGVESTHEITADIARWPYQKGLSKLFRFMYEEYMTEPYEDGLERIKSHPEEFNGYIVGIDAETFDRINENSENPADREKFLKGDIGLLTSSVPGSDAILKDIVGENIKFSLPDGISEGEKEIEIGGLVDSMNIGIQYSNFWESIVVIDDLAEDMLKDPIIDHLDVVYKEKYDEKTEKEVAAVQGNDKFLRHESKIERYKDMKNTENQLTVFGGGIAITLALLGLLNYMNMMGTEIQNRKTELAMLKSIGMTERQQRKMLALEGLFYGLISAVLALITGAVCGYFLFKAVNLYYQVGYVMPIHIDLIFLAFALIICIATPLIIHRFANKGSIVDLLRE